jgi:hypothetical protein
VLRTPSITSLKIAALSNLNQSSPLSSFSHRLWSLIPNFSSSCALPAFPSTASKISQEQDAAAGNIVSYNVRISVHPNELIASLTEPPIQRRLRRYWHHDLLARF